MLEDMSIGPDEISKQPPSLGEIASRWSAIFVPLFAASAATVAALYFSEHRSARALLEVNERDHVNHQGEIIVADFESVASDLKILVEGRTLGELLDSPSPLTRLSTAEEFRLFLQRRELYDQARFLDASGMEVVRVNFRQGQAVIVPESQLQRKQARYYFSETLALEQGDIFVSPFDLNVEGGRIEKPLKPTIRFATPVVDSAGQKRGILVLNYLGEKLLDKLRRTAYNAAGQIMLANPDGHWLKGSSPDEEWSFMYPGRPQHTVASRFPDAWQQIHSAESGQIYTPDGMLTFSTVYPVAELSLTQGMRGLLAGQTGPGTGHKPYYWKIISRVVPRVLAARSQRLWKGLSALLAGGAVVLATISWFLARASVQHKHAQRQVLQSERLAAIGEAMAGLAHESRNALQRSQAGLEMLTRRIAGQPEVLELIGEIQQAQYYLYKLYERVRSYAAPLSLHRRPVDLGELWRETWSHLATEPAHHEVSCVVESNTDDLTCWVDPLAIGQMLRNILENALAAAPKSALIQVAWSAAQLAGRPALRLTVRDNGPGLSAQQQQRIFDPFYTTKVRGTGLGMAISKRIVEAHGGSIAATNRPALARETNGQLVGEKHVAPQIGTDVERASENGVACRSDFQPESGAMIEVVLPRK